MRVLTAAATATALTVALSASPAAADTVPYLPAPTGHQPVGVTSLYLKDTSRPDPWVPEVNYRELMVSVFYPATHEQTQPTKQYMTPTESAAYLEGEDVPGLPLDILSTVRTNAVVDARPTGRRHSLPLVVLSPGYTNSRATLSSLAEDLASHGYVVVTIDHTYDAGEVESGQTGRGRPARPGRRALGDGAGPLRRRAVRPRHPRRAGRRREPRRRGAPAARRIGDRPS